MILVEGKKKPLPHLKSGQNNTAKETPITIGSSLHQVKQQRYLM